MSIISSEILKNGNLGICGTFDMKSNYFGPIIPKKLKKVLKDWL